MDVLNNYTAKFHVGHVVEDVEKTLKNVQEKLHCAGDVKTYKFIPHKAYMFGNEVEEYELKIAMCPIKENVFLEYIQPITPAGFHYISLINNGDYYNHIALYTDDYDTCREELVREGSVILFEAEVNDTRGYRRCLYTKVDGVPGVFEILENAKPMRTDL